jgi:hypothetical protein
MTYADTLIVDGTDLSTVPGLVITDLSGLFAPGTRRGEDDVIPGRRGQIGAQLPYDAYAFTIPIALTSGDVDGTTSSAVRRGHFIAHLRALSAALDGTNGLVTLTRRLTSTDGTGYDTHTAAGRYVAGTAIAMLNPDSGATDLQFINLDGAWYDGANWLVP